MSDLLPHGETLRRAVKWIAQRLQEEPESNKAGLIDEATLRFDLSPKDSEFLARFYRTGGAGPFPD